MNKENISYKQINNESYFVMSSIRQKVKSKTEKKTEREREERAKFEDLRKREVIRLDRI